MCDGPILTLCNWIAIKASYITHITVLYSVWYIKKKLTWTAVNWYWVYWLLCWFSRHVFAADTVAYCGHSLYSCSVPQSCFCLDDSQNLFQADCFLDACSLFELHLLIGANNIRRPILGRTLGLLCRPGLWCNSLPQRLLKVDRKERLLYLCICKAQENKSVTWLHHSLSIFKDWTIQNIQKQAARMSGSLIIHSQLSYSTAFEHLYSVF